MYSLTKQIVMIAIIDKCLHSFWVVESVATKQS